MPVHSLLIMAVAAAPMDEGLREYFAGEQGESYAFMAVGLAGLGAGAGLFYQHGDVGRPLSVPLLVLGLVDVVLGVGLRARTPRQVDALSAQLSSDPAAYQEEESKRMRGVMSGFQLYRAVEL